MDLTEKQVSFEYIYEGRIIKVRCDKAKTPTGNIVDREVCEHPGGVAVLPLHEDGTVTLVRQYRYPYSELLWELPAGKLEPGEKKPETCGKRELEEETGYRAESFISLGKIYPSPGFLNEIIYLYLAQNLTQYEQNLDEDEFVELARFPFAECEKMIAGGKIVDAKTIAAFYRTKLLLAESEGEKNGL